MFTYLGVNHIRNACATTNHFPWYVSETKYSLRKRLAIIFLDTQIKTSYIAKLGNSKRPYTRYIVPDAI